MQKQTREANSAQQRPSMQQDLRELYTQHWQAAGGHMEPFAALYEEHGHEIVEAVQRDLSIQEQTNWYLRQRFAVAIAGQQIHVTVDRTETSTQAPVKFVRTRFGRRKDKPPAETRELLYKLAYQQQHPGQEVELHSHNMSTGEVVPIKMTAKKEQSLYDAVEQSLAGLARDEYPATPAEPLRCPACPFFWICPA
ncbi:MAG: PD-(D/E)XK nuclease family protein [Chloroflexi bacterium]|nr:MAG: PD-(D/E)XK nuclease family protein [Chloroflexota bacterium]